ncbi:GNAT family N-acetyltransferase [Pluralibacter gergoviae]
MNSSYRIIECAPPVDDFCRLRQIAGLSPRPREAVVKALPRSCYALQVLHADRVVGMGRVVGDGVMNLEIVDIAVDPAHQRQGIGRQIMTQIVDWLDRNAAEGAYVTLMADVPELYRLFGFAPVAPHSEGMARVWGKN